MIVRDCVVSLVIGEMFVFASTAITFPLGFRTSVFAKASRISHQLFNIETGYHQSAAKSVRVSSSPFYRSLEQLSTMYI